MDFERARFNMIEQVSYTHPPLPTKREMNIKSLPGIM